MNFSAVTANILFSFVSSHPRPPHTANCSTQTVIITPGGGGILSCLQELAALRGASKCAYPCTSSAHSRSCATAKRAADACALSGQGVCVPLRRQGPQLRRQARRRRLCEQVGARGGQGATSTRLQAGEQFCSASPEPAGLAFAGRCSTLCWLYALNLQLAWLR